MLRKSLLTISMLSMSFLANANWDKEKTYDKKDEEILLGDMKAGLFCSNENTVDFAVKFNGYLNNGVEDKVKWEGANDDGKVKVFVEDDTVIISNIEKKEELFNALIENEKIDFYIDSFEDEEYGTRILMQNFIIGFNKLKAECQ